MIERPTTRTVLLQLISTAPDPTGQNLDYLAAWQNARAILRLTCPTHYNLDGTCPNCHADMEEGE